MTQREAVIHEVEQLPDDLLAPALVIAVLDGVLKRGVLKWGREPFSPANDAISTGDEP